jgi:hypothetical protein
MLAEYGCSHEKWFVVVGRVRVLSDFKRHMKGRYDFLSLEELMRQSQNARKAGKCIAVNGGYRPRSVKRVVEDIATMFEENHMRIAAGMVRDFVASTVN